MKIIGIYKITSPSKRIYIGQAVDMNKRWSRYRRLCCKNQMRLYNSFLKYGVENHIFEYIEECKEHDLNTRERYWQDFYDVLSENGLNCKLTKSNDKPSRLSEEIKNKISTSKKGVRLSDELKLKLSNAHKGILHSLDSKEKMSERCHMNKKVICIDTNEIYDSAKKAHKDCDIEMSYHSFACRLSGRIKNNTNFKYYNYGE